ncbi:hypothetical protein JCM3774_005819 [Rhodotorula dairenensis]
MASASYGGAYVPPYATATPTAAGGAATKAAGGDGGTSISFAQIATQSGLSGGSATTTAKITDSTGGVDANSLLEYFTKPYIDAHTLSLPTWRYTYILWFAIIGTLIVWSVVYNLSGTGTGGSALGAWFRKWSIRRITWTKRVQADRGGGSKAEEGRSPGTAGTRRRVIFASPTVAQMIAVGVLILVALLCSFVGDDYIAPTTCTFGGYCGYQSASGNSGPPKTNYRLLRLLRRGINNPNGWAPFNDPLLAGPNSNIAANAWTAAARLGLISYAMLPLAVTLALKQWPFNIWATPFLTNYHFDKTAILHRWSGRVIWAFATGHAAAWFYQLSQDRDPFGRMVLIPVFGWWRFVAGVICWILLTILTAFSFRPIRTRFYEFFYWSHVLLVILVLVTAILHHRPVMYWPIAALAWWGAERVWRLVALLWINGIFEGIWSSPRGGAARVRSSGGSFDTSEKQYESEPALGLSTLSYPPTSSAFQAPPYGASPAMNASSPTLVNSTNSPRPLPPAGFATAQLLPGRTVRLTIHTPHVVRWEAGQHLLLYVPAVRVFESHPYTIAGVDERAKQLRPIGGKVTQRGSEIVLLVRAQKGFSRALWDHLVRARGKAVGPRKEDGILLRTLVSWPMGSSGRVTWGAYDTLLIVCGGTGITFGISVLESACRRLVRKDQAGDKKWKTTRVRFVWIMREYSHITWVASTLRRCIEMCDASQLQVDLFVTHDAQGAGQATRLPKESVASMAGMPGSTDDLAPPTAPFARRARPGLSTGRDSFSSANSDWSDGEYSDSSMQPGGGGGVPVRSRGPPPLPAEFQEEVDSVTDLVLFEGEDETLPAAEARMSAQLKKEGKLRRALSRRGQGGSLRRTAASHHLSGTSPNVPLPTNDPSFEALPLDYRDDYCGPYGPPPPGDEGASSIALQASQGDLGYPSRVSHTRASSYDFSGGYDDAETNTLGGADSGSTYGLVKHAGRSGRFASEASLANLSGPPLQPGPSAPPPANDGFFIDVSDAEQLDIDAVAELAKTGYPHLKQILDDEVERSRGKTVVACCGPPSLNSVVRNLVAKKIDLKRVSKGDPRGQVSLVVEDFAF